jgi:hypothetical protein
MARTVAALPRRKSERERHASALLDHLTADEWTAIGRALFGSDALRDPRDVFAELTPEERKRVADRPSDLFADVVFAARPDLLPLCRERLARQCQAWPNTPDGSQYTPRPPAGD